MGKIKQGILGGFNGTTGSVVGASWKGIAYMRGKAQSIKNPRTELQMANRGNFGFISDLMSKALAVVNDGFKAVSVKKSPFNTAVQTNMKTMVDVNGAITLPGAKFSDGNLEAPATGTIELSSSSVSVTLGSLGLSFEGNKVVAVAIFADSQDKPLLIGNQRADVESGDSTKTILIGVPQSLAYDRVHVYAFSYDDVTKVASPTFYAGMEQA